MTEKFNQRQKIQDLRSAENVQNYWNTHPLGTQYVRDKNIKIGSKEFYEHIKPWMGPFKFPWIMKRIEKVAKGLTGAHLLEIGCGMGYDSLEFIRRGVKVTATDQTPAAVDFTRRHFEYEKAEAEDIRVENVRNLSFGECTFDAVWSRGVLHATGDTQKAVDEICRVLKPGGLAMISNFYRKPSWMFWLSKYGKENIEFKEEDPPVNDFLTEKEILSLFKDFEIVESEHDHSRALPTVRTGTKAFLYN